MFKRSLTTEAFDAVSVEQKSMNSSTQYDLAPLDKFLSIYSVPIHWVLSVGIVFVLIYLIFEQAAQAELLVKNDRSRLHEIQALKTQLLSQPVHAEMQNEVLHEAQLSILYLGHIQFNHLSKALVELDGEQMLVIQGQVLKLDWRIKELNEQYLMLESKAGHVVKAFRERS
ncbi:MAG: hypothetical protein RL212_374 [Pseudomonadota bacterium]